MNDDLHDDDLDLITEPESTGSDDEGQELWERLALVQRVTRN